VSLTWETIDEKATYPEPRYAATDGQDRYEIHYSHNGWVVFQNGEAWRSTGRAGRLNRLVQSGYPRDLDAAKAMADELAEAARRRDAREAGRRA
jgi:hypothetical protein